MLGQAIGQVMNDFPGNRLVGLSHAEADITDQRKIANAIAKYDAQIVLNTAAYTDVDGCERNPLLASAVNDEGAKTVATACQRANVLLVYVSTDFVFDGAATQPYQETGIPHPLTVYGATKLAGERHAAGLTKHLIIRTAWTFGPGRENFIVKVLKRARGEGQLNVVHDQIGSPTYTLDLARGLLTLVFQGARGLYHIVNAGSCSRFELAQAILKRAGLDQVPVHPVESAGQIARRPAYSVLETSAFTKKTGITLPQWHDALHRYLDTLGPPSSPP